MRTICVILAASLLSACAPAETDSDWPVYLGDAGRRHYSELDQVTRDNVSQLEPAWVYDAGVYATEVIDVNGILFAPPISFMAPNIPLGVWISLSSKTSISLPTPLNLKTS